MPQPYARPLLITTDNGVQDAVLAVADEAQVDVAVAADVGAAAPLWSTAPLVLLDVSLVEPAMRLLPLPRQGLVVVARAIDDPAIWRHLMAVGAEHVVELPDGAPWLFERFGRSLQPDPAAEVVVVAGAVGGAGTSTLAASLAYAAKRDRTPSVLVDLDPAGGGLDLMLGAEGETGARWEELAGITGTVDETVLLEALPRADGLPVLSWSGESHLEPSVGAVGQVLDALGRPPGVVVVDGGRLNDPRAAVALARCQRLVLVVPLRVRAVAAARRLLARISPPIPPTIVASGPAPGGLSPDDLAAALSLPVAAKLPDDRRRPVNEEVGGQPPTSAQWQRVCRQVLTAVADVAA